MILGCLDGFPTLLLFCSWGCLAIFFICMYSVEVLWTLCREVWFDYWMYCFVLTMTWHEYPSGLSRHVCEQRMSYHVDHASRVFLRPQKNIRWTCMGDISNHTGWKHQVHDLQRRTDMDVVLVGWSTRHDLTSTLRMYATVALWFSVSIWSRGWMLNDGLLEAGQYLTLGMNLQHRDKLCLNVVSLLR